MESKILISKGNISLRLMNNTKKDMEFLLNWLTNEQVVRWVYGEGAPWDMDKIVEHFAEKTGEGGSSVPCLIVHNQQEIGYLQYYPIKKDSYKFNSQNLFEKVAEGYGLDMFIGKPELWDKGIGTLTIDLIEDYLKNNLKAKVLCVDPITDNSRAVHFWKKVGFEPMDVIEAYDDCGQKSILMMKTLMESKISEMSLIEFGQKCRPYNGQYRDIFGYVPCRDDYKCSREEYFQALLKAIETKCELSTIVPKKKKRFQDPNKRY